MAIQARGRAHCPVCGLIGAPVTEQALHRARDPRACLKSAREACGALCRCDDPRACLEGPLVAEDTLSRRTEACAGQIRALQTRSGKDGGRGAVVALGAMEAPTQHGHGQARLIGSRGARHGGAGASQRTVKARRTRGLQRVGHCAIGELAQGIIHGECLRQIALGEVVVHVVDVHIHIQSARLRAHGRQPKQE